MSQIRNRCHIRDLTVLFLFGLDAAKLSILNYPNSDCPNEMSNKKPGSDTVWFLIGKILDLLHTSARSLLKAASLPPGTAAGALLQEVYFTRAQERDVRFRLT